MRTELLKLASKVLLAVSLAGVVIQIKGLASDPELMLSWSIIVLLEENLAFLMMARYLPFLSWFLRTKPEI